QRSDDELGRHGRALEQPARAALAREIVGGPGVAGAVDAVVLEVARIGQEGIVIPAHRDGLVDGGADEVERGRWRGAGAGGGRRRRTARSGDRRGEEPADTHADLSGGWRDDRARCRGCASQTAPIAPGTAPRPVSALADNHWLNVA